LDPSELKKRLNKAKKAKRKAEQEKAVIERTRRKKELFNKNRKKGEEDFENPVKDELVPDKLARQENPLNEAVKFLEPLLLLASNQINTHLLAFEIYYRKGKVLMMLQAIIKALALDPANFKLHSCLTRFLAFIESSQGVKMKEPVRKVLNSSLPDLLKGKTAEELNSSFLASHENDLKARLVGLQLKVFLNPKETNAAVNQLVNLDSSLVNRDIDTCKSILDAFTKGEFGSEGKAASAKYKEACGKLFVLSQCFMDPESIGNHVNSLAEDLENTTIHTN